MGGLDGKIFPNNEWEWQTLERDLAHWIRTSGYRLDKSERRPFSRVGFCALASGVTSGYLIHYLLGKLPRIPKNSARVAISVFSGLYSSAISTRILRKSVFAEVLEMNSPLGETAKQILVNARNNQVMQNIIESPTNYATSQYDNKYTEFFLEDSLNNLAKNNTLKDKVYNTSSPDNKDEIYPEFDKNGILDNCYSGNDKFRSWKDIRKGV